MLIEKFDIALSKFANRKKSNITILDYTNFAF